MTKKDQPDTKMDYKQAEKIMERWIGFLVWHVQTNHAQQDVNDLLAAYDRIKNG